MRHRAELPAVNRRQLTCTRRFSTVNDPSAMNNETEKNASHLESVANNPAKQPWHAPEIEEMDFAETQSGAGATGDGSLFS